MTKTGPDGTNEYFDAYETDCILNPDERYECDEPTPKNPEDSLFQSEYYERHFSENWYSDDLRIFVGDSTGEDILSIQDFQFSLSNCNRCTKSFMDGRTAFIANTAGPVRAIRSWVGANSGAVTQREHILYERRDDQVTFVRVHPIPGIMEYVIHEVLLKLL